MVSWDEGIFFLCVVIRHWAFLLKWEVLVVYSPIDHMRSIDFLREIETKVVSASAIALPIMVGGDFNLICSGADKNNSNIDWPRVNMFNNLIVTMALREVTRSGARFTWTNKKLAHVRNILDRDCFFRV